MSWDTPSVITIRVNIYPFDAESLQVSVQMSVSVVLRPRWTDDADTSRADPQLEDSRFVVRSVGDGRPRRRTPTRTRPRYTRSDTDSTAGDDRHGSDTSRCSLQEAPEPNTLHLAGTSESQSGSDAYRRQAVTLVYGSSEAVRPRLDSSLAFPSEVRVRKQEDGERVEGDRRRWRR